MLEAKKCAVCNQEFNIYPSQNHKKYCSKACYTNSQIKPEKRITKKCKFCGTKFTSYIAQKHNFCSRFCGYEARKKRTEKMYDDIKKNKYYL